MQDDKKPPAAEPESAPWDDVSPPPEETAGSPPKSGASPHVYLPPRPATDDARKTLLGKRFAAALIDGIVAGVITILLWGLLHESVGLLAGSLYLLFRDGFSLELINGRSLGKLIFYLRPVRLSGETMNFKISAKRNWPLALPTFFNALGAGINVIGVGTLFWLFSLAAFILVLGEIVLIVTQENGQRFGDQMADTEVRSEV